MLQPLLAGNPQVSVICTISPNAGAVAESTSTLFFARRIKGVKKHKLVDTHALIERCRKEIEDLKQRLVEQGADAPMRARAGIYYAGGVEAEVEPEPKPQPGCAKLNTGTNTGWEQRRRMMTFLKASGLGKAPGGMKARSPVREVFGLKEKIPLVR
ncbi:hypothetical protein BD779DRAFT_1569515 [Infundibulicybe gibba]|nr:hypothetical protein BD779DRAFT_1569515 [Infundibulicybe gibba]